MDTVLTMRFQSADVRTVNHDGQLWWCVADVCEILGIENPRRVAAEMLDEDEHRKFRVRSDGLENNFCNEPGLYRIIFRSNKPEAKKFKRWVFHEVLPAIKSHGVYMAAEAKRKMEELLANMDSIRNTHLADHMAYLLIDAHPGYYSAEYDQHSSRMSEEHVTLIRRMLVSGMRLRQWYALGKIAKIGCSIVGNNRYEHAILIRDVIATIQERAKEEGLQIEYIKRSGKQWARFMPIRTGREIAIRTPFSPLEPSQDQLPAFSNSRTYDINNGKTSPKRQPYKQPVEVTVILKPTPPKIGGKNG